MELYSEISHLALTEDEKMTLCMYFSKNPDQKEEAVIVLSVYEASIAVQLLYQHFISCDNPKIEFEGFSQDSDGFQVTNQEGDKTNEYFVTYKDIKSAGIINLDHADPYTNTNSWYICLPYLWLCIIVSAAGEKSPFKTWQGFINPEKPIYWEEWESFNFQVEIPTSIRVCKLREKYPNKPTVLDTKDKRHKQLHTQFTNVYINGKVKESVWDGFSYLHGDSGRMLLSFQMKFAESDSKNPQQISKELIGKEFDKASNACKQLSKTNNFPKRMQWGMLILSNAFRKHDVTQDNLPAQCAAVDCSNFQAFFGQTFASCAQFVAEQNKIYINMAPSYILQLIPEVGDVIAREIISNRKRKHFENVDDLLARVPKFPHKSTEAI
ncbi:1497_t:CDS:2, partial [Paraglomus brasilianum]